MHHDFVRILWRIRRIALAPIVADGIGKDRAGVVEAGGGDGASGRGVALEAMLRVFVPEVECAVRAGGAESAVDGMEGDGIDSVYVGSVSLRWVAVAFK